MRRLVLALKLIVAAIVVAVPVATAVAQYVDVPLDDPALERRAQVIHKQIRCLVCQNQAISDSNATLARQLREIVRERVDAGDSDADVHAFLVARYGDWVLMRPPLKASTILLWVLPFAILASVLAGLAFYVWRRRGRASALGPPLDDEEEAQLASILDRPQ